MLTNFDRKEGEFNPKSIYELISKYKNSLSFPTIWKLYTENNRIAQISNDCRLHLEAAANQFTNEIWPIQSKIGFNWFILNPELTVSCAFF